ncbi:alkaline phosphatase family protein [Paenibacillus sp. TRM 82003]|uniref:alkaline phosphatase family protein n=1 Tax=Kineococcus sp. TRM81007 TaxID=2925831 RepID=UPI001F597D34|nr:alkaline phosphatase family protein [Kineococcus sp. TRM81007]MCI2240113.1 alkaline phosphatase family protein [Kineococcus sp. TRM81007]MCI3925581.1 alkaline phosphatase family protein [Paenibacillus sp. TRM 82003]
MPGDGPARRPRGPRRPLLTARDAHDALLSVVPTALALWISGQVVAGVEYASPAWLLAASALLLLGDVLVRPVLGPLVQVAGPAVTVALGVAVQLLVLHTALTALPGLELRSLGALGQVYLVTGLVAVVARWLVGVNDSSWVVRDLLRRRRPRAAAGAEPGLLVVQVDGLSLPLLRFGVHAGTLPTIARWLRTGTHRATGWRAPLPSTTPASQAGLLHGTIDDVPAFRWWDPELERVLVANRPADAAVIEERLVRAARAAGREGLLAHDGASIGNVFSGEGAHAHLVVSTSRGGGSGRPYLRYVLRPFGLARSLVLTAGEVVKEVYQGWQQRVRRVEPRIRRRGWYVLLRALTNALLRDLNVALVAEQLAAGRPVVFVDFLDYDEVAHHAGAARAESLDALAGVDRVLGTLAAVAAASPRRYRVVVVSDHGQAQGPTFAQVAGRTVQDLVADLVQREHPGPPSRVASASGEEGRGRVDVLVRDLAPAGHVPRAGRRREPRADEVVGPDAVVVVTAGCTALLSVPDAPGGRLGLTELGGRWPALLPGLLAAPGVGFVAGHGAAGPVVLGPAGEHDLLTGRVRGSDPLAPFGPRAAGEVLRVMRMSTAPALLVHSAVDERTGEVHAFEEQVAHHGGLGGEQNEAVLVHPADWAVDEDLLDTSVPGERLLVGADTVHRQLVRWMRAEGVLPAAGPLAPSRAGAEGAGR